MTEPVAKIGPHPSWAQPSKVATLDPFGHIAATAFADLRKEGVDVRPTIAVTRAHMDIPEISAMLKEGEIEADGKVLLPSGQVNITKVRQLLRPPLGSGAHRPRLT